MNTSELQRLKMAWLAAKEAGDTQTQFGLLRDHPEGLAELSDFIAAYHATGADVLVEEPQTILPVTQRAYQKALERVFNAELAFANLTELRKNRNVSKVEVARGLRLGVDVWNKFEAGAIELVSLSRQQLERLAGFFQVSTDQFARLLDQSQPALTLNRRQTRQASRSEQQGPQKQSFADAIKRSGMTKEDQEFWLQ
ncbi:XRE family transcriptional regulator [Ktedonosporobacter rubrisoli]|uniref:XRE family transcriptional regulator n=1 Tax=Ktedonosporobacter rubrisoli TaxID=2509675 RepID=A0A4P6JYV0_KTERU|nr:helix-turn-helix transcriptional regulator [Ktedonosporobacter rubrisoli]QBD80640.1 XRE family transcriptional regulator [Ktedonosporobacter rubrisoli]